MNPGALTVKRIDTLAHVEQVAAEALELPATDRANIMHSLARIVGEHGATPAQLLTLAAYCIAHAEAGA